SAAGAAATVAGMARLVAARTRTWARRRMGGLSGAVCCSTCRPPAVRRVVKLGRRRKTFLTGEKSTPAFFTTKPQALLMSVRVAYAQRVLCRVAQSTFLHLPR